MAAALHMTDPRTGLMRVGFVGFSWTTLFFGFFPALFRGHVSAAIVMFLAAIFTFGLAWLVFPFIYNPWHRNWLMNQGYGGPVGSPANPSVIHVHVDR